MKQAGFDASESPVQDQAMTSRVGHAALGFAAFDRFIGYILIGAMVVVPAFILIRILSYRR